MASATTSIQLAENPPVSQLTYEILLKKQTELFAKIAEQATKISTLTANLDLGKQALKKTAAELEEAKADRDNYKVKLLATSEALKKKETDYFSLSLSLVFLILYTIGVVMLCLYI